MGLSDGIVDELLWNFGTGFQYISILVNGNTLIECVPVIFDGWKIHHIRFDGAWIRQGTVIFKNAQISGN